MADFQYMVLKKVHTRSMPKRGFQAWMNIAAIRDEDVHFIENAMKWPEKNCKRMCLSDLKKRFECAKHLGVTSESLQAMIDDSTTLLELIEASSKSMATEKEKCKAMKTSMIATMDAEMSRYGRHMTMAEKRKDRQERLKLQETARNAEKTCAKFQEKMHASCRQVKRMFNLTTRIKRVLDALEHL